MLLRTRLTVGLAIAAITLSGCAATERSGDDDSAVRAVQVARAATTVTVVAVGDIACPPGASSTSSTCRQQDTADLTRRLRPDAVLALGDLQYEQGTLASFGSSYDRSWGALKSITHPVPGNHEYRTRGASGYFRYFAGRQPGAPGYYRVRLGAWTAYMLNSNCTKINCAAQRTWLRRALSRDRSKCQLFALHHPRFSSGEHGSQVFTKPFMRIGYRHRVDLVLAGHDHHYERFRRMAPDGKRSARGFFAFVSGAGGKSHYSARPAIRGSLSRNDTDFGVLQLDLRPDRFHFAFKTVGGQTPDSGVRHCR